MAATPENPRKAPFLAPAQQSADTSPMENRRENARASLHDEFCNKYIEGVPHLVRLVDLSAGGALVRRLLEPDSRDEAFPLELRLDGVTLWAWTKRVRRIGEHEALRFVSCDPIDRARLRSLLRTRAVA